jgi:hypothetical protein
MDISVRCYRALLFIQIGTFLFRFSGALPSDLVSSVVNVPSSASLSLIGTGAEVVTANFSVEGSLSITDMNLQGTLGAPHGATLLSLSGCGVTPDVLVTAVSFVANIVHMSGLRPLGSGWTLAQPTTTTTMLTLTADMSVQSDMAVQVGQMVTISGGAGITRWGTGSFHVGQAGSLLLCAHIYFVGSVRCPAWVG